MKATLADHSCAGDSFGRVGRDRFEVWSLKNLFGWRGTPDVQKWLRFGWTL
jgi:hypothetical protein